MTSAEALIDNNLWHSLDIQMLLSKTKLDYFGYKLFLIKFYCEITRQSVFHGQVELHGH